MVINNLLTGMILQVGQFSGANLLFVVGLASYFLSWGGPPVVERQVCQPVDGSKIRLSS